MKRLVIILWVLMFLLSLFACGKTEAPKTNDDTPNEQKEENKQPENTEQNPDNEEDKKDAEEEPVPTDPVSKEVYDLKHNEDLVQAPLSFPISETTNDPPGALQREGSVYIRDNYLQVEFVIPKEGESTIDATIGFVRDDFSNYHFSFKLYLREKGVEDAEYKTIHTNLVPWGIYPDPVLTIYRCTFYHSGLLDIVEVNKTYDIVIAIYEKDKVVGWCENEFTWYEYSQIEVEQAEQNEDIIK